MQEDFLHYLWQFKKFNTALLKTTNHEDVVIKTVGTHNLNSGPDFFNAQLKINHQDWAGNVEIHVKSSDWYVHNHEIDPAYDNVILHVVWEHDVEVFRNDKTVIPTLVLKNYTQENTLNNYKVLFAKTKQWINCENDFKNIDAFIIDGWLERLYIERLERKSLEIDALLKASKNNWEAVLFKMLAKNFGSKVNGDAFFSMANGIEFAVVRKLSKDQKLLEALFFGLTNLLHVSVTDNHTEILQKEYHYLSRKFKIDAQGVVKSQFFRLRPANFPTIRLSQLAGLYSGRQNLFSKIIDIQSLPEFYTLFQVTASTYWDTHYTFGKVSSQRKKTISKSFIDLLLINTIIPLKFSFAKFEGKLIDASLLNLIANIKSEKNSVVDQFNKLKKVSNSALQSQGLLQLKNEYCSKNKCLKCAIGSKLLNK